jgi:signal transduction histidine kinase
VLELSEREDALMNWLESHGAENAWETAPMLAQAGLDPDALTALASEVPDAAMPDVTAWLAAAVEINDLLAGIQETTGTISQVVGAFKDYTYMDQGEVQEVDVHEAIEQTLTMLQHRMEGVTIERDLAPALPRIMGSGSELNQILTNVVDNAIDAVGGDGTVRIATGERDGAVVAEVSDDGVGIAEEEQYRVFEPFYTTKEVGQGTGLGLDIARRAAEERFGGEITFTSEPGATVFKIVLPLAPKGDQPSG